MGSQKLTEYERKRLENIRRNDEMIAALNIHSKASLLSAATKRSRVASSKSYKASPDKKPKTQTPVVLRRSLRTRGVPPDSKGLDYDPTELPTKVLNSTSPRKPTLCGLGPISLKDAYTGSGSDRALMDTIKSLSIEKKPQPHLGVSTKVELDADKPAEKEESDSVMDVVKSENLDWGTKKEKREFESCVDLELMSLEPENVARVVPGRIMVAKFMPCDGLRMIAVANKFGNIAFWNVDYKGEEEEDGIFLYQPHSGPISGIVFRQSCLSKVFTSCYDGFVRLMDAEKEVFDLVYSSNDTIYSLSQQPSDMKSLYFGEGRGGLSIWDERTGRLSSQWILHEDRINSIDFNSQDPNIMVTSSTDGTACLWDLRSMKANKPKSLKIVTHKRAVHSAYFSPSGKSLATTSADDRVGILSGLNFEDTSMIYHCNQTGRWISSFRAIWGWDDSFIFIGNMKRGVDVISPVQGRTITTLQSPHMSAIPCRFDAHPYKVGTLAGATSGGQIYMWTSR